MIVIIIIIIIIIIMFLLIMIIKLRWNHLSNTSFLTRVFFTSGE